MKTLKSNNQSSNNKMKVPFNAPIKDAMDKYGVAIGGGMALISGVAFVSAKYFSPINKEDELLPMPDNDPVTDEEICDTPGSYVEIVASQEVIQISDDQESFSSAFENARKLQGPGGLFEYKGELYNTYFKEEWDSMSIEEKNDYYAQIGRNIDNESSAFVTSFENGEIAVVAFKDDSIIGLIVMDEDGDGIYDVAVVDINLDGEPDYYFPIEKNVVNPSGDLELAYLDNQVVDVNLVSEDIVEIDEEDHTLVDSVGGMSIEEDNIFDDSNIGHQDLPDLVDNMDMGEFQL